MTSLTMSRTTAPERPLEFESAEFGGSERRVRPWMWLTLVALFLGSTVDLVRHFFVERMSSGLASSAIWLLAFGVLSAVLQTAQIPNDFSHHSATPDEARRTKLTRTQKLSRWTGVAQSLAVLVAVMSLMTRMSLRPEEARPALAAAAAVTLLLLALSSLFALSRSHHQAQQQPRMTSPARIPSRMSNRVSARPAA